MTPTNGITQAPWAGRRRAAALHRTRTKGARTQTPCCLCGQPINYQLRYPDPHSCSVQHVLSRTAFPHLTWDPTNWAPAHLVCNQSAGDGTNPATNATLGVTTPLWDTPPDIGTPQQGRLVVLLCGPQGAGKTTTARQSGLTIYDRDDERWDDEPHFNRALDQLGHTPLARAVVIRSGATSAARHKTQTQIGATHTYLVTLTADEAAHRVIQRNRDDKTRTLAGIAPWWKRHDNNDHTPAFPGWQAIL